MKTNYLLFLSLIFTSTFSFSQTIIKHYNGGTPNERRSIVTSEDAAFGEKNFYKKKKYNSKVFGDTLFYEDFDGGIPTGWSVVNNLQNNNSWKWDTIYQQGNFTDSSATLSTGITAIKSTTAANGFMSLPSDFYNTPKVGTGDKMDTYFESSLISHPTTVFSGSVLLSYQQYLRYCCEESNRLIIQVSTDSFNTIHEFDATDELFVNTANAPNSVGVQINAINIGCAVSGATDFRIRILSQGNTYYFWMIDDLAILDGPSNDLELESPFMEFNATNYAANPFYGQIPYCFFPNLSFSGKIKNNSLASQTNVELNLSIDHLKYPSGGFGNGNVYSIAESATISGTIAAPLCDSLISVITGTPAFVPSVLGDFEVEFEVTSDSVDQILSNGIASQNFTVTDTIFAKDDGEYTTGNGTGPASYVDSSSSTPGGTQVGDRFASLYTLENRIGHSYDNIPTSITLAVSGDSRNIGVEIEPKIWEYHEDSLNINGTNFSVDRALGNEIASSFLSYTIKASDTNNFISLPLTNGTALTGTGLDSGQYAVGWEVTNLPHGKTFSVANDLSTAAMQPAVTAFVYFGHATNEGWGAVGSNPVIRLNMGNAWRCGTIGVGSINKFEKFEIYPNPTKDFVNINSTAEVNRVQVYNMQGQKVQELYPMNQKQIQLNLQGAPGIYFVQVHLTNGEVKTTKVVKQ